MHLQTRPLLWYTVRVVVAATLLTILLRRVELSDVWLSVGRTGWPIFLAAVALFSAVRWVAALQLREGLEALGIRIRLGTLFRLQMISNFYSLLLPSDLTGGAIVWLRLTRVSEKATETLLTVGFFRLLNTLTLLFLGAAFAGFDEQLGPRLRLALIGLLVVMSLFMLPFISVRALSAIKSMYRPLFKAVPPGVTKKVTEAEDAIRLFSRSHSVSSVAYAVLLSVGQHALGIIWMYGLAQTLGLDISIFVVGWVRTLISLLQMLPITVAGLGVREVSLVYLLEAYSVPGSLALAYSLGIFSVNLVGGLIGGISEAWNPSDGRRALQDPGS